MENKRAVELSEKELKSFLTFEGEEVLIAKRQHPLVLTGPISSGVLIFLLISVAGYFIGAVFLQNLLVSISIWVVFTVIFVNLLLKIIVDYYFHLYIITNRKLLEIYAIPMFTDRINEVLLDQVRTTEISVRMPGMLYELFDMGDVNIAFDRPSHEQEFVIDNISYPNWVGSILSKELQSIMHESPVWFQPRNNHHINYNEDTFDDKQD